MADACHVPVILYSVPGNTAIDMAPEVVISLASHPNIIGLKDSGGDVRWFYCNITLHVHRSCGGSGTRNVVSVRAVLLIWAIYRILNNDRPD